MAYSTLTVSSRTESGKGAARRIRDAGKLPGTIYGPGKEPVSVIADPKEVVAILHGELGKNTPITLTVEGDSTPRLVIIREYQVHPVKRRITHVDFWEIREDQELLLTVPFAKVGRAEAERKGGRIRVVRSDVKVKCKPADVPAIITYDLAQIEGVEAVIHIADLEMPAGVTAFYKDNYSLIQLKVARKAVVEATDDAKPVKAA